MYSLNVPVPGAVERLAARLHPRLTEFETIRERHTLVVKRFEPTPGPETRNALDRLRERLLAALSDQPAFEARVTGVDYFLDPPRGADPVVYLDVEGRGLRRLHRRLVGEFGAIEGLEGEGYVPHVTLARGGTEADAARLAEAEVDPVTWTVSELAIWSGKYQEIIERLQLPG